MTVRNSGMGTAAVAVFSLLLAACSDGVGVPGATPLRVQLATAGSSAIAAAEHSITTGSNTLVISGVELVASEIELEAADGACQHQDSSNVEGADSAQADTADENCEEVEAGPVLLDLPLTPGAQQTVTTVVPAGTYHELQIKIRPPEADEAGGQAFLAAHPDLQDVSVRVTGTFNGTPFTFTSAVQTDQELHFPAPLVATGGAADLTIFVNVDSWFLTADSTGLIDPALASAGTELGAVVEHNIKASFEAFEDQNHDGNEDGSQDGANE